MNWALAIDRNRQPLLRIVATLFGMIGLGETGAVERVSRPLYRAVLSVLRPAEAAVRRLIVVAAHGMVIQPRPARPAPAGRVISPTARGRVSFRLCDPRQTVERADGYRYAGAKREPRIRFIDVAFDPRIPLFRPSQQPAPAAAAPEDDGTVNATPLCRRLAAIRVALQDLPRQARRYARWRARPIAMRRPPLAASLRPGPPPGLRKRKSHEIDDILAECHWLARTVPETDTS